jgi:hypothetical protein
MGYYGASHCHTNPLLEQTRDPFERQNSAMLETKYVSTYPKPVAAKAMRSVKTTRDIITGNRT